MSLDLFSQESTEGDDAIPSYMIAANNHNTGNMNPSLFQENDDQEPVISRAGKFMAVSAASGVNSFYNTAVWAGNMFSDKDAQYRDTRDWINTFDEDLGNYYQQNRQAADIVGFVASSFVPGLGGVKVFNAAAKALTAAKEGSIGINMARGLGVLPGSRDLLVKEAIAGYDKTRTAFSLADGATIKAVAAGFGEQTLQALAFETAVAVTMKKSPILADADVGDMLSHIASGAVLGGAIGGVMEGAGTLFKIRQSIGKVDTKLANVTQDMRGVDGTAASDELLIMRNDLDTLPRNAPEGVDPGLYDQLWEKKLGRIENKSIETWTKIAGNDAELGARLHTAVSTDPTGNFTAKVAGLTEIFKPVETAKMVKKYGLDKEDTTNALRHLKLWGDDMGKLSDEAPAAMHLADTIGGKVEVRAGMVIAGDKSYKVVQNKFWSTAEASYEEALAHNIWAMDDTVPMLALGKDQGYLKIGVDDIPMLTKAYREGFTDFKLLTKAGEELPAPADLLEYLKKAKNDGAIDELTKTALKGKELPVEQMANKYDTTLGFITGEQYSADTAEAIFGLQSAQKSFYQRFRANTTNPPDISTVKPWLEQQNVKMVYDTTKVAQLDNFQVEAMTMIRQRQVIQQTTNDMAVASAIGERAELLAPFTDTHLARVNRGGAGPGFFSFSNAAMGTAGQLAEFTGGLVTKWIKKASDDIAEQFMVANYAIVNNPTEAARLAAVLQKTRATGSRNAYVLDDAGDNLVLKSVRDYERKLAAGEADLVPPIIPQGVDDAIDLGSDAVRNWVKQHLSTNGTRGTAINNLRAAKGQNPAFDPEVFYPPAPNPDRFKFHAFVVDDSTVTSTGHVSMLYATDAVALEKQIAEARKQKFNVFLPDDTADYYKARGKYDYSLGLNENQINSALSSGGSSAPAFPLTGTPQEMIQDIMEFHAKQEAIMIREAVSTKYSRQFGTLKQMGDEYAKLNQAKFGFKAKYQDESQNPFGDYVKTFMGASLKNDYPLWTALNNFVDEAGTKVYNSISGILKAKNSDTYAGASKNGAFDEINKIFDGYGMKMAATDAQMEAHVNHPAGKAVVSKFIQTQNAIMSALVLRMDPVNALNNILGGPILTGTETLSVFRLMKGAPDAENALAGLMKVVVPGTEDAITSPSKLIAGAYKEFFGPDSAKLLEKYKNIGTVSDISDQYKQLIEVATIKGTETAAELGSKEAKMYELFRKVGDFGEKWTGNKVAEEMQRFVASNIMDKITAVAVKAGRMDEKTANTYINTFVNRTQGNMIASQRPQMFQGPIGQAIGLFQTYQFNIMQQMLRYVGEGSKKDALTLLGLQGTVYGMNGLPAFQAINQHIIGTASGNTNHTDAYTSINNIVGKNAGDWITYGVASNFLMDPDLKINMYSRGDINPRQVTIVPTNMADIPFVASWAKLASSTKNALSSVANGGDIWNSLLSGIEQNGINRPLAGLARVARGIDDGVSYSTSGKGNVISANDFYSLANLARISGAKPFDEAVMQDEVYRSQAYQAADKSRRDNLGRAVKSVVAGGGVPSQEQMNDFMEGYVKLGGKQEEFNKWYVSQLRAATTPQANKIIQNTDSPYAKRMQTIMGGRMAATPADILANQPPQE